MREEMQVLVEYGICEHVARPEDIPVVGGTWVYNVKEGSNNNDIFKARFVAKGYSQEEGIYFSEEKKSIIPSVRRH
jgi:hypothetical protein